MSNTVVKGKHKLFSFLGKYTYQSYQYKYEGCLFLETRFVQTAVHEYLRTKVKLNIEMVVFLTKEARENNWEDSTERLDGLESVLKKWD